MALLAQNTLRMELHALDVERLVAQPHDLVERAISMLAPGGDLEAVGQRLALHHQRMISGHPQGILETAEYPFAAMANQGGLAMHYLTRANHAGTKRLRQRLMTKADTENGQLASEMGDGVERDACLVGSTGAGRDNQKTVR